MTEEDYEKRFVDLEMKLAYLEDFMNQLQEVAVEQAKTIEILKKLKHQNLTIGLEITSNSLILTPEILKQFDYFIINGKSFSKVQESQNLILFSDMIARLGSYKGTIIDDKKMIERVD